MRSRAPRDAAFWQGTVVAHTIRRWAARAVGVLFVTALPVGAAAQTCLDWTHDVTIPPRARVSSALAYDSRRAKTVLFGGTNGDLFGATWEWNGTSWTEFDPPGPVPSPRYGLA